MGLRELLSKLASDNGVELDDDELDGLGLSDDEISLDEPLPGKAAGVVEIFLADTVAKTGDDGLVWTPIMYEGQWALRPDGKGGKARVPLKIVAGRSRNQRREIGLQDIFDAHADGAVESVTVPETHDNKPTENHGYVEKLKVAKTKLGDKTVTALFGGMDIKIPETKRKMELGAIAGRSAGILYDYERTDSGKKYPVVLEHVALTSRQWLRGMPRFGRKLSMLSDDLPIASLRLSDEGPSEDEYALALAESEQDDDFLADTSISWSHEDDPKWLQQQVDQILSQARSKKYEERRKKNSGLNVYIEDRIPSYRCTSAKPGSALISDGYGDGANYWVAGISVSEGEVVLDDVEKWQATKQVWVPDEERDLPKGDKAPLSDNDVEPDALDLAQAQRHERATGESVDLAELKAKRRSKLSDSSFAIPDERKFPIPDESHARNALARAAGTKYESRVKAAVKKKFPNIAVDDSKKDNYDQPRGGGKMAGENTDTLQLSDEARNAIAAAEARAKAAEDRLSELNMTVDKLVGTANANNAQAFIGKLKGMGLTEERGFGGMLVEVEQVLLADDGKPALQADHFADDRNKTGELTLSEAFDRVFGALRTAEGTTLKLGEVVTSPSEQLDKDGNPVDPGKPGKGDEEVDLSQLSDDEILKLHEEKHPGVLAASGLKISSNGEGEK